MSLPDKLRPPRGEEQSGIILALYPSSDARLDIELQRSSSGSTFTTIAVFANKDASKTPTYTDLLPLDGGTRNYRARHSSGLWWAAGPWTATVSAGPLVLPGEVPFEDEAFRRINTFYDQNGVLASVVGQREGVETFPIMTGYQSGSVNGGEISTGSTWADGPAVTFPSPYVNPPVVKLFPEQGVVHYEPTAANWTSSTGFSGASAQAVELTAVNVTETGFTPRARLVQRSGSLTARTANFSTGNSLALGQSSTATPANAPSYNDQYTVHYRIDMTQLSLGTPINVTAVIAADANTTGGYVQYASKTYAAKLETTASTASWDDESQTLTVSGVGSTDKLRVRFKTLNVSPGTTGDVEVLVHAFDGVSDPSAGVTYQTQSGAVYAPMCASTADTVTWIAWSPGAST